MGVFQLNQQTPSRTPKSETCWSAGFPPVSARSTGSSTPFLGPALPSGSTPLPAGGSPTSPGPEVTTPVRLLGGAWAGELQSPRFHIGNKTAAAHERTSGASGRRRRRRRSRCVMGESGERGRPPSSSVHTGGRGPGWPFVAAWAAEPVSSG